MDQELEEIGLQFFAPFSKHFAVANFFGFPLIFEGKPSKLVASNLNLDEKPLAKDRQLKLPIWATTNHDEPKNLAREADSETTSYDDKMPHEYAGNIVRRPHAFKIIFAFLLASTFIFVIIVNAIGIYIGITISDSVNSLLIAGLPTLDILLGNSLIMPPTFVMTASAVIVVRKLPQLQEFAAKCNKLAICTKFGTGMTSLPKSLIISSNIPFQPS